MGRFDEALKKLCTAASLNKKLGVMIHLFSDIASVCTSLENYEAALAHLHLENFVREEQKWPIPYSLKTTIGKLTNLIEIKPTFSSKQDTLSTCRELWKQYTDIKRSEKRTKLKNQKGKLILLNDKTFCFIETMKGISAFCRKEDIPENVENGTILVFDAIPSFDKKKQKDSWKAVNIRI